MLALAPVKVQEFANRYRLPLTEPDSVSYSPVKLNIYTLSRILSDTAQGPVEPAENVIEPQLPGVEGKPILWTEVVGSAPFFLRFDEWLARQQPFFAENLFALRTQVVGASSGVWLTDGRKKFLEYHKTLPDSQSLTPYNDYFGSMDEVHRSATFLLAYGAADAQADRARPGHRQESVRHRRAARRRSGAAAERRRTPAQAPARTGSRN